jgi:phage baseplate assembly protein V
MSAFRVGIVASQDPSRCRVRVEFPDRDGLTSWWLPVLVAKTQNDKSYYLPDVGEQVVCLMDEYDEDGAVLGSIYSDADQPPGGLSVNNVHWAAQDGGSVDYDRAAHRLSVNVPAGGTVTIAASGASIAIDKDGNVNVSTDKQIHLGSGELKGVARLGDTVSCPAGTGTIVSASTTVWAQS